MAFSFDGFLRDDGGVGIRNHLVIAPLSICADPLAEKLSHGFKHPAIYLRNQSGCCQIGKDYDRNARTLIGLGTNPNVGALLLVVLGCEGVPVDRIHDAIAKSGRPTRLLHIQKSGGSIKSLGIGLAMLDELREELAAKTTRTTASIDSLTLGLECGGSDTTSGIAANPSMGWVTDRCVEAGGTVILSETTEIIGAEHILGARTPDPEERKKLIAMVNAIEQRAKAAGINIRGSQPTPGNIRGGLTTIEEKSLGCIYKAGRTSPVMEAVEYGAKPRKRGLVFMDTPGQDVESMTGMAAGGAQIMIFSTGLGSPVGFPLTPVIKITGNPTTFKNMSDDLDVNAGTIIDGEEDIAQVGARLFECMKAAVRGELTKSEKSGYHAIAILKDEITL